ncbi:MAG: radical SAM protein [Planctomycetota bacterium]|jgi:radical SAM superfamily enzyme YgiQ (UPF0313 family)
MRYREPVFRPPSEAMSLLIQVSFSCPHNRCTFCGMYKGHKFGKRPVGEVLEDIEAAKKEYGAHVRSVFLPDGNSIFLPTDDLVKICEAITEAFPELERITSYGSARFVVKKTAGEWKRLRESGLSRIHMGIESGDPEILKKIKKGATRETFIEAANLLHGADFEISEYILVGIGGKERSKEHAVGSATLLNEVRPHYVRLRTWVPVPNAPMFKEYESDDFKLLDPYDALKEMRLLIENLECETILLTDHVSNFADINGRVPDDRADMLASIDEAMKKDRDSFRPDIIRRL